MFFFGVFGCFLGPSAYNCSRNCEAIGRRPALILLPSNVSIVAHWRFGSATTISNYKFRRSGDWPVLFFFASYRQTMSFSLFVCLFVFDGGETSTRQDSEASIDCFHRPANQNGPTASYGPDATNPKKKQTERTKRQIKKGKRIWLAVFFLFLFFLRRRIFDVIDERQIHSRSLTSRA